MRSSCPSAARLAGIDLEQVAHANAAASARPLRAAFACARATSACAAFDAATPARRARDGQREVAEPAEQVGDALARLRIEQLSARRTSTR